MSQGGYKGITIREAMERINDKNNGWYLPIIQRPYVWGKRDGSEEYICLLVDSLMRGFPIGGIVIWETDAHIGYRRFMDDYIVGKVEKAEPEEKWDSRKCLVYDGQQRLQTLHSVLYHSFNGRVLYFDLLFDSSKSPSDETGFYFKDSGSEAKRTELAMLKLMGKSQEDEKFALRDEILDGVEGETLSADERRLIEKNLFRLWDVFVRKGDMGVESIAYFPIESKTPEMVNEVFRRLNVGGMPLSQLDMVLAKIKNVAPHFEEELWDLNNLILKQTGYAFSDYEIVQLIYLLIFNTTRVDESKVKDANAGQFEDVLVHVKKVLPSFFKDFLFEQFHINANWLVVRQQALLPLMAYLVTSEMFGFGANLYRQDSKSLITYFVKSQLCDWNTQTMVTEFSRLAMARARAGEDFPLKEITEVAVKKNRTGDVHVYQLLGPVWFSLKILMPNREYVFPDHGRKPQIDHIFPYSGHNGLPDEDAYKQKVDVLWNKQPTPAELNNYKRCKDPRTYFKSDEGRSWMHVYDFLPDLDSPDFANEDSFIAYRRKAMLKFMKDHYDINVVEDPISL